MADQVENNQGYIYSQSVTFFFSTKKKSHLRPVEPNPFRPQHVVLLSLKISSSLKVGRAHF